MVGKKRLIQIPKKQHILLLGARGTGKSTLLRQHFEDEECFWIDLLRPQSEDHYAQNPGRLEEEVKALPDTTKYVVIDEVQKVPKLLDVVHLLIESTDKFFILTGSSARKLKRGAADLLAGRALVSNLFPFTHIELGSEFDLQTALGFGTLPRVWHMRSNSLRRKTLQSYALTYLKEEIQAEQIVRNLNPFRKFLEVAAQSSGKILSFSNIAADVGADDKTVKSYFQILEDTLVGFFLEAYDSSVRKRLVKHPKFYFFDTGVARALARTLTLELLPQTQVWGDLFEHFVICEAHRLSAYSGNDFKFSYLRTHDDLEIDLVVDRPGKPILLVEIKSTPQLRGDHLKHLLSLLPDFPNAQGLCLSCEDQPRIVEGVECLPWQVGLKKYFSGPDLKF